MKLQGINELNTWIYSLLDLYDDLVAANVDESNPLFQWLDTSVLGFTLAMTEAKAEAKISIE